MTFMDSVTEKVKVSRVKQTEYAARELEGKEGAKLSFSPQIVLPSANRQRRSGKTKRLYLSGPTAEGGSKSCGR